MAEGVRFSVYVQPYESYTQTRPAITLGEYTDAEETETAYRQIADTRSYGKTKFIEFSVAQPYNNTSTLPKERVSIELIDEPTESHWDVLSASMGDRNIIDNSGFCLVGSTPITGFNIEAFYIRNIGNNVAQVSVDNQGRYDLELNQEQSFFSRMSGTVEGDIWAKAKTGGTTTEIEYILFEKSA